MHSPSSLRHRPSVVARLLGLHSMPPRLPKVGLGTLVALMELRRQRAHLRTLDTRLLNDVGLEPSDAQRESERAIWDVPTSWRL